MKALVYQGIGKKDFKACPKPDLTAPSDVRDKTTKTTICGTGLHIVKDDVATCRPGRSLAHEGVGVVDKVGTQAEFVRIPHAERSRSLLRRKHCYDKSAGSRMITFEKEHDHEIQFSRQQQ